MKDKTKKLVSILMLVLILLSSIPINAFAAFITDINSDAQFGVISGSLTEYGHELHYSNYDGTTYLLFCTQYGMKSPNGSSYSFNGDFVTQYKAQRSEYEKIAEYIYFGYTSKHGMGLPTNASAKKDACCTQQFVWEYIKNNIDGNMKCPSRDSWKSNYMSSGLYANWLNETESAYNQYHRNTSINGMNVKVNIGESTTLNDSNGVLAHYESFSHNINGITFSHTQGSNDLNISVSADTNETNANFVSKNYGIYELMPNGRKYDSSTMGNYVYFQFNNGAVQNLMFSNYVDPSNFNISVEVQSGKIALLKTNNMGNAVSDCVFELYRNAECTDLIKTATTGTDGRILYDKLKPMTYYIKEKSVATGYLLDTSIQKVDVVAGQTANVTFRNNEPTGQIKIYKLSTNNDKIAGAEFEVKADEDIYNVAKTKKYYSKGDLVATRTMDKNGKTTPIEELPLGKYLVKEDVAPKGYLLDKTEYSINLEYKDQYTKVITNTTTSNELVKKMGVHIFKSGIKENSGETPGLAGAEFTIKLNSAVEKALDAGYSYEEIWNGIDENGNKVKVDAKRVAQAQKIAPTYDVLITDKDGNAYTQKNLPYGKYIVKESNTPKDYESASDFYFSITDDETEIQDVAKKTKHIVVNNEQLEAYIKLIKKDLKTDKIVTLSSTTFEIKATKDIYDRATGKIIWKKGESVSQKIGSTTYNSFTTNADNMIIPEKSYTTNNDDKGTVITPLQLPVGSYAIYEINTPKGFLQLETPVTFDIKGIRDYDKDQDEDFIKEVTIKNEQPTGTLMIDKTIALRENIDTSIIDTSDLSGIEFKLIAKEDIIDNADGSKIYSKGQEIGTYNLNKNGNLKVENLPMGTYELEETKTLDGLVLNDTKYEIKFEQEDLIRKVYEDKENISNDTTIFEFSKKSITGDDELEGAKLSVTDENGKIIDTWTSSKDNHKIEGLIVGKTYKLNEEIAPDGYTKATSVEFKVENTKEIQKVEMIDKIVTMSKKDIGGNEIEGAKIKVFDKDGNVIDEWVSSKENHNIKGLTEGEKYILHEEYAPDEFVIATDVEFEVTYGKETQDIVLIDKRVEITKTDLVTGDEIEGAELQVIDENGNIIDEWISTKEPHKVTGLEENKKYELIEKTAPYGYETTEKIEFVVTTDKETQKIEMKDMPILKNIKLNKIDSKTKELIKEKFVFGIYEDEECNNLIKEVKSNKNDGYVVFDQLRYGKYYIKEIKAPVGYELSNKIVNIEINDNGVFADGNLIEENDSIYSIDFENDIIEVPNTGDNRHTEIFALIGGLSAISLAGAFIYDYKKKSRKKKNK
jgi:uncharacterized surface anchored protein